MVAAADPHRRAVHPDVGPGGAGGGERVGGGQGDRDGAADPIRDWLGDNGLHRYVEVLRAHPERRPGRLGVPEPEPVLGERPVQRGRPRPVVVGGPPAQAAQHRHRDAVDLALDQIGGGRHLVRQGPVGHLHRAALRVRDTREVLVHNESRHAEGGVDLTGAPRPAQRVGDHDPEPGEPGRPAQRRAQRSGRGIRIRGQGEQGRPGRQVRGVDPGRGQHRPRPRADDPGQAARGEALRDNGFRLVGDRGGMIERSPRGVGEEPALGLGDHLAGHRHDVALGQLQPGPGQGLHQQRGQVVPRAHLGQPRHRDDAQRRRPGR